MAYFKPVRIDIHKNIHRYLYIASKIVEYDEYGDPITKYDDNGNEIVKYEVPERFKFNYQPISAESDFREFGALASSMQVATIRNRDKYLNKFKELDVAYLNGVSPLGEFENGDNGNYRIYAIRDQNVLIRVYFIKRVISDRNGENV